MRVHRHGRKAGHPSKRGLFRVRFRALSEEDRALFMRWMTHLQHSTGGINAYRMEDVFASFDVDRERAWLDAYGGLYPYERKAAKRDAELAQYDAWREAREKRRRSTAWRDRIWWWWVGSGEVFDGWTWTKMND